jgi:hypothetical protein
MQTDVRYMYLSVRGCMYRTIHHSARNRTVSLVSSQGYETPVQPPYSMYSMYSTYTDVSEISMRLLSLNWCSQSLTSQPLSSCDANSSTLSEHISDWIVSIDAVWKILIGSPTGYANSG